ATIDEFCAFRAFCRLSVQADQFFGHSASFDLPLGSFIIDPSLTRGIGMTQYNIALIGFGGVNRALAELIAGSNDRWNA
ncbi:MAG: hypothetical protein E5W99_27575, partial [Mesorhizobium sp.]